MYGSRIPDVNFRLPNESDDDFQERISFLEDLI